MRLALFVVKRHVLLGSKHRPTHKRVPLIPRVFVRAARGCRLDVGLAVLERGEGGGAVSWMAGWLAGLGW